MENIIDNRVLTLEVINGTQIRSIKNKVMTLITKSQMRELAKAGYNNEVPILKFFLGPITWYATCVEDEILYGYGDMGMGIVEWGSLTALEELPNIKSSFIYMERDKWFTPDPTKKLSDYYAMTQLD